ncbi:MAG: hypothetical protein U0411_03235 [Thermodesulfovibrionales bacterium]
MVNPTGVLAKLVEVVQIRKDSCVRLRHKNAHCRECSASCPVDAIQVGTVGEGITIEWNKCIGCGICCTVCKTGVYTLKEFSDRLFIEKCRQAIIRGKGLEIRCKQAVGGAHPSWIEVPCLGIIDPAHLIGMVAYGASSLHLRHAECGGCSARHGDGCAAGSIAAAESLLRIFSPGEKVVITAGTHPAPFAGEEKDAEGKGRRMVSRRELFRYFKMRFLISAAETVDTLSEGQHRPGGERIRHTGFLPERRRLLIALLKQLGTPPERVQDPSGCAVAAELEIDGNECDMCGMCCHFCPTHALREYNASAAAPGTAAGREIRFRASDCVKCNLCLVACYRNAIRSTDSFDRERFIEEREKLLRIE